ncbi:hypothetical protein PIB30_080290 [Stylosanthes scabra]|uniref:Aminotransferase-like plant mobile domain-containing protein n=1 Tax=Stylosanthes scabra TaxID=79078 RepID=A0ABU6SRI0_9FABA|nr:hypothetical protein [Stylosanthes scabra]
MAGGRGGHQLERDPDINRLDRRHHVAGAIGFQDPRTLTARGVVPTMPPPDCLVPYIREAGFSGPLQMRLFDYDMPLVFALVERWRPKTHSFHLPWGGRGLLSRTSHGRRPDQRMRAGLLGLVWGRDLGDGPKISGRTSPGRRGEELRWGEAELAKTVSADDSKGRDPAGCPEAVCPLLRHDDDRRRLVPRQDQQHRVAEVGPAAAGL